MDSIQFGFLIVLARANCRKIHLVFPCAVFPEQTKSAIISCIPIKFLSSCFGLPALQTLLAGVRLRLQRRIVLQEKILEKRLRGGKTIKRLNCFYEQSIHMK